MWHGRLIDDLQPKAAWPCSPINFEVFLEHVTNACPVKAGFPVQTNTPQRQQRPDETAGKYK
jgi:hypothetical protein